MVIRAWKQAAGQAAISVSLLRKIEQGKRSLNDAGIQVVLSEIRMPG